MINCARKIVSLLRTLPNSAKVLRARGNDQLLAIPKERFAAPLLERKSASQNALDLALSQCADDLRHIAEQSSMVIAVGDIGSTIIWTASSAQMQSAAERVHFVQGGQWREEFVGTNALALSLKTQQSSCVFPMNIIWSRFTIGFVMRHPLSIPTQSKPWAW